MGMTVDEHPIELASFPSDWKTILLGSVGQWYSGGTPSMKVHGYWSGDVPWVSPKDMKATRLYDSIDHISPKAIADGARLLPAGALLMVIRGMILAHSFPVARAERPLSFNQDIKAVVTNGEIDSEYLLYWLVNHAQQLRGLTTESTHGTKRLPPETLYRVCFPVPPRREQDDIARTLADVEAWIDSLDTLIAKKRQIKQGVMQQLLTGNRRLPGFFGEWQHVSLGQLGTFAKGSGVRKDQAGSGNIPCVRYGELYTQHADIIRRFNSFISPAVASTALRLRCGDVIFAGSGETKAEIGKCVAFLQDFEAYAGGDTVVFRPLRAESMFLGYLLNTRPVQAQKARFGQGDAVVHISASALARLNVVLPGRSEQAAIGQTLNDMDLELFDLQAKLVKSKQLVEGITQTLLTGRIRLAPPAFSQETQPRPASTAGQRHNWQINEAVVISVLSKMFGSDQYPLGRKRYTKLSYLLHRHVEGRTEGYLKKAAGPYNPSTKYGGPEKIALGNKYVRHQQRGTYEGFVAAEEIGKALEYFEKWYGADAVGWLEQFRYARNDDLELWATVDMAVVELRAAGRDVDVDTVKEVLRSHPEWSPKLDRDLFANQGIADAIVKCEQLF